MNLPFNTLRELAIHLRERHFPHLHTLPYNRYSLDESPAWWLSPTTENPAFRYGKVGITTNGAWTGDDDVLCGFSVEKGILHEGFSKPTEVMSEDWAWHRFVKRANEPLAELTRAAHEDTSLPVKIAIQSGTLRDDSLWDVLCFDIQGNELRQSSYQNRNGTLQPLAKSSNFEEFAQALEGIDGEPSAFHWIDLAVGATFAMKLDGPDDADTCAKLLKVFSPWMREGV